MKIGVLIPTRGDRPQFLAHALYLLSLQTHQPDFIEIVDDPPKNNEKDITWRYRIGFQRLRDKGADLVFFWEDDDYYKPEYISNMCGLWILGAKPIILGIDYSQYYHLKSKSMARFNHPGRSSAYCTVLRADIDMKWPKDSDPFTDLFLWENINGIAVTAPLLAIGMKHGIGMSGGGGHKNIHWYKEQDYKLKWLSSHVDKRSLEFYADIANTPIPTTAL